MNLLGICGLLASAAANLHRSGFYDDQMC